jgi:hypothetical protein
MPSAALSVLYASRLPEVRVLLQLDPTRSRGARGDRARTNAVNRGAAVLLAAHFQGYLEELMVEVVDQFNLADLDKWDVPQALMAAHIERHLGDLASPSELVDRLQRIEKLFETRKLYWTDCRVGTHGLDSEAVTRHISNPWPGVIKRCFRLAGGDDPFSDPELDDPKLIERRVRELVGKRNEIAHGTGAPSLTAEQLDGYLDAVQTLARALDDQAARLIQETCGLKTRPWA